jgi:hypothetical protein
MDRHAGKSAPTEGPQQLTTTLHGCPDCAIQQPPPKKVRAENTAWITCFDGVAGECCDKHVLDKFGDVVTTLKIQSINIKGFTPSAEPWIYKQHNITQADREALDAWLEVLNGQHENVGQKILEELARVGVGPMSQHHQNLFFDGMLFGTINGSAHARYVRNKLIGGGNASTAQTLHDERELLPKAVKHWRDILNEQTLSDETAKACLESVKGGVLFAHHPDKSLLTQSFLERCT